MGKWKDGRWNGWELPALKGLIISPASSCLFFQKLDICHFSWNRWTMTSLMTSSWHYSKGFVTTHITYQVWLRSDEKWSSYRAHKVRGRNTGNDVNDDVITTKFNSVLHFPLMNNPLKFHQDWIRISQVIVFTRMSTDRHYDYNTPRFAEG